MDIIDSANETNELYIQVSLSNRKAAIKSYNDMCIWCHQEPVAPNSAYCSKDCGDDHERYKRKNG